MSYPILYEPNETEFQNNGLGILNDCIYCLVTEVANGSFELEMKYPMDGIHFNEIEDRSIIKAKSNKFSNPQLFRVYRKTKPISGKVIFYASHISYDLSGIPVSAFSARSVKSALRGLGNFAAVSCPFSFETDKDDEGEFFVNVPSSVRSRLGGSDGSILDVFGGEYEFDNYVVRLHNERGTNRGVSIRYGKNMTDIKQEENCANVYTGIYPYWVDSESGEVFELPKKIVRVDGNYDFEKILAVDFTSRFEEKPTEAEMTAEARYYIVSNKIGVPKVSLTVSFYQHDIEEIRLFDTVSVYFQKLRVSSSAKVVETVYDVLLDKLQSVTLGSVHANIADTIAKQRLDIFSAPTQADVQRAHATATNWLTSGKGYKVERRDQYGMVIDTLYLDEPDIDSAVNVMKIGNNGISLSQNGVNGTFHTVFSILGEVSSFNGSSKIDLKNNSISTIILNGKRVAWEDSGDGKYYFVGIEDGGD